VQPLFVVGVPPLPLQASFLHPPPPQARVLRDHAVELDRLAVGDAVQPDREPLLPHALVSAGTPATLGRVRVWDGTISGGAPRKMLGTEPWQLKEVAEELKLRPMNGRYEIADAKKIAARFVIVGSPEQVERAKVALTGPLRGEVDPRVFKDWEQ
jgi:hypothetical protein